MSSWDTILIRQRRYDELYWKNAKTVLFTSTKEAQTLVSVILLSDRIVTENESTWQTILDAGLLDMLLRIYVIFPSFSHSALDDADGWSALLDACRSRFYSLSHKQNRPLARYQITLSMLCGQNATHSLQFTQFSRLA